MKATAKKTSKPRISADARFIGAKLDELLKAQRVTSVVTLEVAAPTPAFKSTKVGRFEVLEGGAERIVRDTRPVIDVDGSLYHLEWSHTLGSFKFDAAVKACKDLRLGGHGDWYLPQRHELESILDLSKYNPAIDKAAFPDTKSDWYWSSTLAASSPSDYAWFVDFLDGSVYWDLQYYDGLVRACRRVPARQ